MTRSDHPQLSVGFPVYNAERYLAQALDSILDQTFSDFELILSDNASTDSTGEICRDYAARDRRVRYLRNPENIGGARNQVQVVSLATAPYFKWAHHDDLCAPDMFERCLVPLAEHPEVILAYPLTRVIDAEGQVTMDYRDELHLLPGAPHDRLRAYLDSVFLDSKDLFTALHGVFRTEALRRTRLIGSYASSDRVFMAEVVLLGRCYEVPHRLFYKRMHPNSSVGLYPSERQRMAWYNPTGRKDLRSIAWKHLVEYHRAIRHIGLPALETLQCHAVLSRWVRWNFRQLVRERHFLPTDLQLLLQR